MRDVATMQEAPELGIPEVKPAIELVRGRLARKMSPRRRHAILQFRLSSILNEWAGERGEVGSEWRCYILPLEEKPSSLVPDVAYFSFERMPPELGELREKPTIAPDVAVEVLSPGDRRSLLDEKIGIYLANGAQLVIVVDPATRSVEMHDANNVTFFTEAAATSTVYPDLLIDLTKLFAKL